MEIAYPPRNARDQLDQTPHRGDGYMDDFLPLLEENERLGADKSENEILSVLAENAQLRGLVVTLSNILLKKLPPIKANATSLSAPM